MQLYEYLPFFVYNTKEFKELFKILQPKIDNLFIETDKRLTDMFVLGCSEYAVKRYEKIVGIMPKLTDSLEKRQYDILVLYNQTLPFTLESLQKKLNAICGEDGYTLEMIYDKFILNIKLSLFKKHLFFTINNLLEWIVPVNLIINFSLDYNVWGDLSKYKWGEINKYRWGEIKESEEIKNKV